MDLVFNITKQIYYRTVYVLKGWEDPSEHVNTNCVERPQGTLICRTSIK